MAARRTGGMVLLLLVGLACRANANACDDHMGGDMGYGLRKVRLRGPRPPAKQSWVVPLVDRAIRDQKTLDKIFSWPRGSPKKKGCKIQNYVYTKLCVPNSGGRGNFRTKLRITSNCGLMNVKYRLSSSGMVQAWGRSAS